MIHILSSIEDVEVEYLEEEKTTGDEPVDFSSLGPDYLGPTWSRGDDGKLLLPEHTLGWEIIGWCEEYLLDPNDSTQKWSFTREQARFVLWWYAVDSDGNWKYRRGVLQRMKGW